MIYKALLLSSDNSARQEVEENFLPQFILLLLKKKKQQFALGVKASLLGMHWCTISFKMLPFQLHFVFLIGYFFLCNSLSFWRNALLEQSRLFGNVKFTSIIIKRYCKSFAFFTLKASSFFFLKMQSIPVNRKSVVTLLKCH